MNNNECLIKVASSGINPSDALAATGYFKHANLPRIPGRDFAGTVVEGPMQHLILGKQLSITYLVLLNASHDPMFIHIVFRKVPNFVKLGCRIIWIFFY